MNIFFDQRVTQEYYSFNIHLSNAPHVWSFEDRDKMVINHPGQSQFISDVLAYKINTSLSLFSLKSTLV